MSRSEVANHYPNINHGLLANLALGVSSIGLSKIR